MAQSEERLCAGLREELGCRDNLTEWPNRVMKTLARELAAEKHFLLTHSNERLYSPQVEHDETSSQMLFWMNNAEWTSSYLDFFF